MHDLDHMSSRIEPPGEIIIESLIADLNDRAKSMKTLSTWTESTDVKDNFKKYTKNVHTLCKEATLLHELNKKQRTEIDHLISKLGEAHDAALAKLPPS